MLQSRSFSTSTTRLITSSSSKRTILPSCSPALLSSPSPSPSTSTRSRTTNMSQPQSHARHSSSYTPIPTSEPGTWLEPPTPEQEKELLQKVTADVQQWFDSPRFSQIVRPYPASLIATKRGILPAHGANHPTNLSARKLWNTLSEAASTSTPIHTMGAIDPVQMTQMAEHQRVLYVSGWACSSVLTTAFNEVGPDLADYPYTTVPNQVQRLRKAQELHDKKHWDDRCNMTQDERNKKPWIDYLRPIIADADTGHGGLSSVMKLAKIFGESGVAAIHMEDQLHGGKKCGHQAGKVLVPFGEHVSRLIATRLQWDIMGLETLLIARTDAESAKLISSNADERDHKFILGVETEDADGKALDRRPLSEEIAKAEREGKKGDEIDKIEKEWMESVQLITFDQAVERAIKRTSSISDPTSAYQSYLSQVKSPLPSTSSPNPHPASNRTAREIAASIIGREVGWSWDLPRTREGFYHYDGGVEAAMSRVLSFSPYADLLWLETKTPDVKQATGFAKQIRESFPGKWLVYNLSPSFNWGAHGFSDQDLKNFIWDLGKAGFVLQLISLAGLHSGATITSELSRRFKTDGMLAYVELVQRREKELGVDVLTHQKWSGAKYVDRLLQAVSAGSSSTSASGADSTETQFH